MALENIEIKENLKECLCEEYERNLPIYKKLSRKMEDLIKELIEANGISVKSVNARTKEVESLARKIEVKNYKYTSLSEITDLTGVRVITYYADDVYKVENIIKNNFRVDRINSIDKAKILEYDRFGYLSLHYVVQLTDKQYEIEKYRELKDIKFEIQIRSILQDAWAEIEHDLGYKNKNGVPQRIKRDFSRLAGLLELADKEFLSIRDYIHNYENEIIPEVRILEDPVIVDDVSVRSYIKHNEFYRALLYKLGEEVPIKKMSLENDIAKHLTSIGIITLNEVEAIIRDNHKFIINMMKYEKVRIYNYIGEADILLYVCYAKLLNESKTEERLIKFWDDNGYTTSEITYEHKLEWIENLRKYMDE